jgi:lipoprotein-anchoring transpeptidase ErfK/SrfK
MSRLERCIVCSVLLFFSTALPAGAKVEILVDLDSQRMTVVKNRAAPIVWKISSGRAGYETPTGVYTVQRLDADHFSDEYDQAPMPFAIFFSQGLAIHGTYQGGLGRPASHGCVRLSVSHARELFGWVEKYGAAIEITGSGFAAELEPEPRAPRHKRRRGDSIGDDVTEFYPY